MSFDLALVPRPGKSLPERDSLSTWINQHKHLAFHINDKGHISYENPVTGAYFTLLRGENSLDFNLNYSRPTFFALESFEVLDSFVRDFSLLVNNPQTGIDDQAFDSKSLVENWREGNRSACS